MKDKLSDAINLQSFVVAYDHIMAKGWTVDEVKELVKQRLADVNKIIMNDPSKDLCPFCQAKLIVKTEFKEVISFCSVCDYESI